MLGHDVEPSDIDFHENLLDGGRWCHVDTGPVDGKWLVQ
jgi:hypothetical protein